MLNFAMFLANSSQEIIQTIWFDPYYPHKVFIMFHQRFILFSISNAFKKLNQRQENLIDIVHDIMIVFRSVLHFPMSPTNFDQRTIRSDTYCPINKTLNKFLTDPLIFLYFKYFQEI